MALLSRYNYVLSLLINIIMTMTIGVLHKVTSGNGRTIARDSMKQIIHRAKHVLL